jgi:hypothetical protein
VKTVKRRMKKNDKLKSLLEGDEEIGFIEEDAAAEDLSDTEVVRECMDEEFDEESVISRVRLF